MCYGISVSCQLYICVNGKGLLRERFVCVLLWFVVYYFVVFIIFVYLC